MTEATLSELKGAVESIDGSVEIDKVASSEIAGSLDTVDLASIRVYRAVLRPGLGDPTRGKRFFTAVVEHCMANNLVGMGWPLDPPPTSPDEAARRIAASLDRGYGNHAADNIDRLADAPTNSLVWTQGTHGEYRLGRLKGEWRYDASEAAAAAEIHHVRDVAWVPQEFTAADVPSGVVLSFSRPGATFSKMHDGLVRELSDWLYADASGESHPGLRWTPEQILRGRLHWRDVEDLVITFLQAERNYIVVPSSRGASTATYELVLIDRADGTLVLPQVKTGNAIVDIDDLLEAKRRISSVSRVIAYSTEDRYSRHSDEVEELKTSELLDFAARNPTLLPPLIRRLMQSATS